MLKKVKFLRDVKGYTQQEVSDKLKMGLRTVQRIEKEIRNL